MNAPKDRALAREADVEEKELVDWAFLADWRLSWIAFARAFSCVRMKFAMF